MFVVQTKPIYLVVLFLILSSAQLACSSTGSSSDPARDQRIFQGQRSVDIREYQTLLSRFQAYDNAVSQGDWRTAANYTLSIDSHSVFNGQGTARPDERLRALWRAYVAATGGPASAHLGPPSQHSGFVLGTVQPSKPAQPPADQATVAAARSAITSYLSQQIRRSQ